MTTTKRSNKSSVDLAGQLRKAIERSGLNRFQLSKQAGVSYAAIHRFAGGEGNITLDVASRLAAVVGLEFRPTRPRPRKG